MTLVQQVVKSLQQTDIYFADDVTNLLDVWNELFEAFLEDHKMDRMGQPLFFGLVQRLESSSLKVI